MFRKIFNYLDVSVAAVNKTIAVTGMILGVLLAFINVVLRYVFNEGLSWAGELTNYLFIWSALFGAAYGFKKGIHISVTLLLHAFPVKVAKFFVILASLFSCIFLIFMAYFGAKLLPFIASFGETSPDLWNLPMWIPMIVLPLSFTAAAFRAGEKVYEFAKTPAENILKSSEDELVHDSAVKE
ncbi:MAG: TRAP transporter small permease [Campylobacteraceae bacterium]|jgi:C4-dicarboxylate transporter DctQ subunit|nr:TRAP transporter small permease [Campylobacteraceae bacterium]